MVASALKEKQNQVRGRKEKVTPGGGNGEYKGSEMGAYFRCWGNITQANMATAKERRERVVGDDIRDSELQISPGLVDRVIRTLDFTVIDRKLCKDFEWRNDMI